MNQESRWSDQFDAEDYGNNGGVGGSGIASTGSAFWDAVLTTMHNHGQTPAINSDIAASDYAVMWADQATNISSSPDGTSGDYFLDYTATSSGKSYTGFEITGESVSGNVAEVAALFGEEESSTISSGFFAVTEAFENAGSLSEQYMRDMEYESPALSAVTQSVSTFSKFAKGVEYLNMANKASIIADPSKSWQTRSANAIELGGTILIAMICPEGAIVWALGTMVIDAITEGEGEKNN
jgi:hypothetical protein